MIFVAAPVLLVTGLNLKMGISSAFANVDVTTDYMGDVPMITVFDQINYLF